MEFEEAKKVLEDCTRSELRDHAFGDREVFWEKDGKVVAEGYFGSSMSDYVTIDVEGDTTYSFTNDDARSLMNAGTLGTVGRNDETGPDEYLEGRVMPGLTLDGVRQEVEG
jgi:hypothetical protein